MLAIDLVVVVAISILTSEDGGLLGVTQTSFAHYPVAILVSSAVVLGTISIASLMRVVLAGGGRRRRGRASRSAARASPATPTIRCAAAC